MQKVNENSTTPNESFIMSICLIFLTLQNLHHDTSYVGYILTNTKTPIDITVDAFVT